MRTCLAPPRWGKLWNTSSVSINVDCHLYTYNWHLRGPLSLPDLKLRSKSSMSAWVMIKEYPFFLWWVVSATSLIFHKKMWVSKYLNGPGEATLEFFPDPGPRFGAEKLDTSVIRVPLWTQDLFQLQKSHVDDNWRLILHWLPWEPSDSSRSHRIFFFAGFPTIR